MKSCFSSDKILAPSIVLFSVDQAAEANHGFAGAMHSYLQPEIMFVFVVTGSRKISLLLCLIQVYPPRYPAVAG